MPSLLPQVGSNGATMGGLAGINPALTLHGQVEMGAFGRRTQATTGEIATLATVSLIRQDTNETVASTVTDRTGGFNLNFGNAFRPTQGTLYYIEAVKGLGNNRAGVSVARLRTLVGLNANAQWVSLSGASGNYPISISRSTTALSTITSLRQTAGNPLNANALIGSLQVGVPDANGNDTFTPGASGLTQQDYAAVIDLVTQAITRDQDPLGVIIYDTVNYVFVRVTSGFTVSGLSPASGPIGTTVTISGTNLDPDPTKDIVRFNGVQATVASANSTALTVQVPSGATTGLVSVQIGGLVLAGVTFTVTASDGHNIFDPSGNLYVASQMTNEIYKLSPAGVLTMVASSSLLNSPQSLTYYNGTLYVASANNSQVATVGAQGNVAPLTASVPSPRAIATSPGGTLYVANNNNIYTVNSSGVATLFATGFGNITGLAFKGATLYVADANNNQIRQVATDGTVSTFISGLNSPQGLAFDTAGNLFVASQGDNTIVKFDASGLQSLFANVSSPVGLAFNANGTFYTTSQVSHAIYQITASGAVRPLAPGLNDPVGLNIDSSGNIVFVSRGSSSLMKAAPGGYLGTAASGFSRPNDAVVLPDGTIYTANYNSSSISKVTPAGNISVLANIAYPLAIAYDPGHNTLGVATAQNNYEVDTINLSSNAVTRYYNPVGWTNKLIFDPSGNLYGTTSNRVFKVASGSLTINGQLNATTLNTQPWGLWYEASNSLLVTIPGMNKVVRMDPNTGAMTDVITTGLNNPYGVAEDSSGAIYVANSTYPGSIVKWANGALTTIWSGNSTDPAALYYPGDLTIGNNKLYIANYNRNVLQYDFGTATGSVALANGGTPGFYPYQNFNVTVDSSGTLYAPFYKSGYGYRYAEVTSTGTYTDVPCPYPYTVAVNGTKIYGYNGSYTIQVQNPDGTGQVPYAAGYYNPQGITFDSAGNLLVPGYGVVVKTDTTTGLSSRFAWYGNNQMYDVAINPVTGDVYSCDYNYVYKVGPTGGAMTTLAYNWPLISIAFDSAGNLYSLNNWYNNSGYNYIKRYNPGNNSWTLVDIWCYQPRF